MKVYCVELVPHGLSVAHPSAVCRRKLLVEEIERQEEAARCARTVLLVKQVELDELGKVWKKKLSWRKVWGNM